MIEYSPDSTDTHPKEETKYALEITHNSNLHELFKFDNAARPTLTIIGGGILIDSNEKLCPQKIYKSLENVKYNTTHRYISEETNGEEAICVYREFNATVELQSSAKATIFWPPFQVKDGQRLFGYLVYFLKTDENVTIHTGFDSCAP